MINVYCKDNGWLFDDLKREIALQGAVASQRPIKNANAWICVRESEAHLSPNPAKTVVQIHDVKFKTPKGYGAYSRVHSAQGSENVFPIGSREIEQGELPERPTIGFFCREDRGLKRSDMFYDALSLCESDFDVLQIGSNLKGEYEPRGAGIADYKRIDALVTCSVSPMIPLSAYEALACGRAVITTPRQWLFKSDMIKTGGKAQDIARLIDEVVTNRKLYKPLKPYCRTEWAKKQVELARALCKK